MESLEERDCSDGGPGGAGPVVGNVAVAVVIGSSVAMATTQGPEFLWVDIAVHLVVFAVAFIASIRNNRALGLLFVVLSPLVMFWGLSQLDLQGCMYYGGERCETGTELVVGAYVVGTALLAGGAALAFGPKRESANAADRGPRQTAMERYQTDLLELRCQGTITEALYHTRLLELRSLARPKAEGAITDDEFEAAAARLLDS